MLIKFNLTDWRTLLLCLPLILHGVELDNKGEVFEGDMPNIVIVYADDMGYGSVSAYDPEHCAVPTPHTDRLAQQGMRFTNAANSASLCSPSRYSLLTGRYSWRSRLESHVVRAYGTPLIHPDRLTLPGMLKDNGYHTACIGKWHLGWDWPISDEDGTIESIPDEVFLQSRTGEIDFSRQIPGGPVDRGFDYYFGIDVPNYPPYAYFRNDRLTSMPTASKGPSTPERWGKDGPMQPDYRFDEVMPTLVKEAEAYIDERAQLEAPFFLYFALTIPHEPIAPSAEFKGKSGISGVADLMIETDAALGRVMAALERNGLEDNTILIFASDNGHASYTPIRPFIEAGHRVNGPFSGYKGFVQEGGLRVPFIVRWPGNVEAGSVSDAPVNTTDIMSTCAAVVNADLPSNAAEDSFNLLPLLKGEVSMARKHSVTQGYSTAALSIQRGPWKLSFAYGSGDPWGMLRVTEEGVDPGPLPEKEAREQGLPPLQLYHLPDDPGEEHNLQASHPEVVSELTELIRREIERGRSTSGPVVQNDRPIKLPSDGL